MPAQKVRPSKSYEGLHLSRKTILANLKIGRSKMQPLSRNQRPDLLTSLMNMSLLLCLPCNRHLCRSSSNVPHLPTLLKLLQNLTFCLLFVRYRNPCACHAKNKKNYFSKIVQDRQCLRLLTSKCASRHNCVHFLDISTSKVLRT